MTVLDDTENNQGFFSLGMIAFESASPENKFSNVIDVYSIGHDFMSSHVIEHLTVHEDTIFIVKTVEENNERYYTWKGEISDANRPLFDRYTVFTNTMSIIENNSESLVSDGDTSERLVVFYGECLSYFNPPEE